MSKTNLVEQKREVMKWLEVLYENSKVPLLDDNDSNLILELYKIQQRCKEAERDLRISNNFQKQQSVEYDIETRRMNDILQETGLSSASSTSLDESLEKLTSAMANVADLLGVDNPSENDIDIALANVRLKASNFQSCEVKKRQYLEKQKTEMLESIRRQSQSENALQIENKEAKYEQENLRNFREKTTFFNEKSKEYSRAAESNKMTSMKNGLRKQILYENIVDLKKKLENLEENELKPKQLALAGYHGLPPSMELAKAKIAEAKNELELLNTELMKKMDQLEI